jgi:hypothetical protein
LTEVSASQFACSAIVSIIDEWAENEENKDCTVKGIATHQNEIPMRMTTLSYMQGDEQGEKPTRLSAYRSTIPFIQPDHHNWQNFMFC